MACQAQITPEARAFHEKMFPGYVSNFLRTDPEFIERFDNFAFGEVVAAPAIAECPITLECKVMCKQLLDADAIPAGFMEQFYPAEIDDPDANVYP